LAIVDLAAGFLGAGFAFSGFGRSSSTSTPGSTLPSRNSSDAPPPVEM
jgi:hypothetical protein